MIINKVLSITKAVANYGYYLLKFYKANYDIQVNLTECLLIGPKRNNMFFKSYSNDGTLLQLTPDSVFKYGSVTRY